MKPHPALVAADRIAVVALLAAGLGGCAVNSESISLAMADPLRYELYDCKQIAAAVTAGSTREQELRGLIERAERGGAGGTVVAAMAYRNDYLKVRGDLRVLSDTAHSKGCDKQPSTDAKAAAKPPVR